MRLRKALGVILLVIGLLGFIQSTHIKADETKPTDTNAQDVADLRTIEDRFMTAFRAKDVDAIMQLCVPDDTLVVFDVTPPRQRTGAEAYRKTGKPSSTVLLAPYRLKSAMSMSRLGETWLLSEASIMSWAP